MRNVRAVAALLTAAGGLGSVGGALAASTAGAAPSPNVTTLPATPNSSGWTATVGDGGLTGGHPIAESSPNVVTDGGRPVVVVGDRAGGVYGFSLTNGAGVGAYDQNVGAQVTSTPAAAPGGVEVVGTGNAASDCSGGYQWIRPTGSTTLKRATNPGTDTSCASGYNGVQASMAVGTLQGVTATVAGSLGQNEYAFNAASGATLGGFPWYQGDTSYSTPAIADVEGTGSNQIVEGGASTAGVSYTNHYANGGHIRILRATGNAGTGNPAGGLVCQYTTTETVTSSPAVGKFLAGTGVGIVVGTGATYHTTDTNKVIALNTGCGVAWIASVGGTTATESPALADVMGNGHLQVVMTATAGGTGLVYALTGATGGTLWVKTLAHGADAIGSPATVDLGNGHQDVLVASGNGLYVLTGTNGSTLEAPLKTTTGFQNTPLVTKDPNGQIGITVAGATMTRSVVYHWSLPGTNGNVVNEAGAWPQFHHDPQLTGNAGTPPPVVQVTCKGKSPGKTGAHGYYLSASDGGIFDFGNVPFCGSTGNLRLNKPVVGIAASPTANGYWEVASDGGLFAFGTVGFYGSMGGTPLNAPVVGMAATPDGKGYWEVASDGGIFAFGDAQFYGSMGGQHLNAPIVGIAATPTGHGYWEVASDGGIFAFGTAQFHGSMGGTPLNASVVGIAATHTGNGYWEVAADGGIFAFGTAQFHGSMGGQHLNAPIVGMASNSRSGYWFVASDGGIFAFTATFHGSMGGTPLNKPVVGMAGF